MKRKNLNFFRTWHEGNYEPLVDIQTFFAETQSCSPLVLFTTLAPLKTRSVSFTHTAPWFTPHLRSSKPLVVDWSDSTIRLNSLYTAKCIRTTSITTRMPSPLPKPHTTPTLSTLVQATAESSSQQSTTYFSLLNLSLQIFPPPNALRSLTSSALKSPFTYNWPHLAPPLMTHPG